MSKEKKSKLIIKSPKGMHDLLPSEILIWDEIYEVLREVASQYSFMHIETPIVESASLFERSLGEVNEVREKQMFFLQSKGSESLVLRPEGTASIIRAYIENGMRHMPQPVKVYYFGPMFRYEQPQAGRFRQFHQAGFEIVGGESDPIYDAQIILVMNRFLDALGIKNLVTEINSIGCKVCRQNYKRKLIIYYKEKKGKLCPDCEKRLNINPLRLLDCKVCEEFKDGAPIMLDYLCRSCNAHFKEVLEFIEELGIPYRLNHYLVRGLDYYNRTVFEIFTDNSTSQEKTEPSKEGGDELSLPKNVSKLALGSGGRYDFLSEMLGARSISAAGGAVGIERILEIVRAMRGSTKPIRKKKWLCFVYIGEAAKKKSLPLIDKLINSGFSVSESLGKESLKSQFRLAEKEKIEWSLLFGQKEAFEESIILRDMKTGVQETIALKDLVERLRKRIK